LASGVLLILLKKMMGKQHAVLVVKQFFYGFRELAAVIAFKSLFGCPDGRQTLFPEFTPIHRRSQK